MKTKNCKMVVTNAIDNSTVNCTKSVECNVNFNSKYESELQCTLTFYVVENCKFNVILGLDFLGTSDISFEKKIIVKRFKDCKDRILSYRVEIPMYDYSKDGEKFKPAQIVSCLETTKLKLSLKEKLELKGLLVGTQEKLEIEKKLRERNNNKTIKLDNNIVKTTINNNNSNNTIKSGKSDLTFKGGVSNITKTITSEINNNKDIIEEIPKGKVLETISEEAIENERNLLREKFTEIIVEEIPDTQIPIRRSFDMEIKIKPDSKPIKRNCGIIEESVSDYSSIPFFARDKTGKSRFVIDYRAVNDQTIDFAFPMPNADDTLERTKNAKWFSKIYCKSGFHLLNLVENSRQFTAFRVGNKLYQFKRCAFGLKNSPAYFNRWIQSIMDEFDDFALAYVDDIVIFSDTFDDHIKHLNMVLDKLKANKIYLSTNKCKFFEKEIEFVGHVLSSEGIRVRDSKVDAILDLPEPSTVKQVRSLIGACNYYKKFIRNFTTLTYRLTELTKSKSKKVVLDDDTKEDIKQLKLALTSAPLLMKPNHAKPFKVYIDASNHGTGLMITQVNSSGEEQPELYDSKKFNKFQKNYNTTDKEFLALTNVLEKYEYLLIDKHFDIYTDHLNLTYYQKMKDPRKRLIRALDLISKFKFSIIHIPGENNIVADMLSRDANFVLDWDDHFIQNIIKSYEVVTGKDRIWFETVIRREDVVLKDGIYYFIDPSTESNRIILVDKDQIRLVLDESHSTNYAGHLGRYRLGAKIRNSFIWARFWDRISNYVTSCVECQKNKLEQEKHGMLNPLPIPARPWDDITMDFLNLPTTESGMDQVLVIVDRLSKMVRIIPCKKTITSAEVAEIFWRKIVCNFGLPLSIVSDNDKLFTSELWTNLMNEARVKLKTTAPARPQADGQTERTNRVIIEMLSKMTNNRLRWDEEIANIELAINTAVNSSTKLTPASIVYGFELRMPHNINTTYNLSFTEGMEFFTKIAQDNMFDAQVQQAVQYNKTREDIEYEIGDLVLVKRSKLNTIKLDVSDQMKLLPNYSGPFAIIEKKSNVNYRIRITNNKSGSRVVNVDDIKPFLEEDRELFNRKIKDNSIPLEDEIEEIVEKRNRKYGTGSRIEYLIRFKNSSEDHDKWVPQYYLDDCKMMVDKFEKELSKVMPIENNFKKKYL
ncbi:hypothetical protein ACTFIW_010671 [Dictyostelium discoideum]